ncbi:acyl-CoA dehydrogenase family protein [Teichococcus oryzae]|uniref:Acyl-CoA dehydrogenase n=1 Tax=Teichococcus oryzae TaxID=1608942 RepID=A0A5B2TC98_9PROT|nr:acyl-CoA dehydrogenase family protein [Pseudoroseomonas oryzae]KAA2212136.1 acyl-CoA dehydrogenase [Pseudoroseomonas oryzae]
MPVPIGSALNEWLDGNAAGLDDGRADPASLLPRLAAAGLFGIGVPAAWGGQGGEVAEAVEAIAAISSRSLAAGFVFWSQRTYIEFLLQSPNEGLRSRLLPDLLTGALAGATGLSNAMKFLAGLEALQITAAPQGAGYSLDGRMPWVTNLRPQGFHVAAAIAHADGSGAMVASLPSDAPGLRRTEDLSLLGLRGTNTAAIDLHGVKLSPDDIIHPQAGLWLPQVRPAFLGLQCGMSIGLARRALQEATERGGAAREVLRLPLGELSARLAAEEKALRDGLRALHFQARPAPLFELRIRLADIVAEAVGLELQASGGRAYLQPQGEDFARRWREAAFIPVITPSLVQLKAVLAARPEAVAGCAA